MASQSQTGPVRGWRWFEILQAIRDMGIVSSVRSKVNHLTLTDSDGDPVNPLDFWHLLFYLNTEMEQLSHRSQRIIKGMLITVFTTLTFTFYYTCITSGGARWVINPLISNFEFPTIPEHAMKVFVFCKYSFAICLVYNLMRYAVDRKEEMVTLMDELEVDAATLRPGQSPESQLDASVPRPEDNAKTREARQLLSMRRLLKRGVFTFDVIPEPEYVEEPKPTEEEMQMIREAMELEAVKRLNDPGILREYIRRRESRQGRRRVHSYKIKEQRNKDHSKALKMENPLNVIVEEDGSASQTHQKAASRTDVPTNDLAELTSLKIEENFKIDCGDLFPSDSATTQSLAEFLPCVASRTAARTRSRSGSSSRATSSVRAPLQAAKWPVSGTCRPTRPRRSSPPPATLCLYVRNSRSGGVAESSEPRHYTPTNRRRVSSEGPDSDSASPTVPTGFIQLKEHRAQSSSPSPSPPRRPPVHSKAVKPSKDHPTRAKDSPTRIKGSPTRAKGSPTRAKGSPTRAKDSPTRAKASKARHSATPTRTPVPSTPTALLPTTPPDKHRPTTTSDDNVQKSEVPQPKQLTHEQQLASSTPPKSRANTRGRASSSTRSPSTERRPMITGGGTTGTSKRSTPGSPTSASRKTKQVAPTSEDPANRSSLEGKPVECTSDAVSPESGITSKMETKPRGAGKTPGAGDSSHTGYISRTASPSSTSSPDRKQTLVDTIYAAWRDNVLSKQLKKGFYKSATSSKYASRDTTPQGRTKPKFRERRPSAVRDRKESADKTAGDRIRPRDHYPEHGSERCPENRSQRHIEHRSGTCSEQRSDRHSEHHLEKHSAHRDQQHLETETKVYSTDQAEEQTEPLTKEYSVLCEEKCPVLVIEKCSKPLSEKHSGHQDEKYSNHQGEKHSQTRGEEHSDHRGEEHTDLRRTKHSDHRGKKQSNHRGKDYFNFRGEKPSKFLVEKHSDPRGEKQSDHRCRKHSDHRCHKHFDHREEKHSDHRGEKQSDHRGEKQSAHRGEKQSDHRGEKQSAHRGEKPSDHRGEKQSDHREEKPSDHRGEKQSDNRGEKQSAHRGEKQSAHRGEKPSDHRGEKQSDHRGEKPSDNRGEKHSEHCGEKHAVHRVGKYATHRAGKHSAPAVEKLFEYQFEKLAERRSLRHAEQRTERLHRSEEPQLSSDRMLQRQRLESSPNPTSKELKKVKTEVDLLTEAQTFSTPNLGTEETSEANTNETLEDTNETASDALTYHVGEIDTFAAKEAKPELEISNLLEPRGNWSDSASSMSGLTLSLTSTMDAFMDFTVTDGPDDISENSNFPGH